MAKIVIDSDRCKGCMLCIGECPADCIEESSELNSAGHTTVVFKENSKCTGCGLCYRICPDCCIEVYK